MIPVPHSSAVHAVCWTQEGCFSGCLRLFREESPPAWVVIIRRKDRRGAESWSREVRAPPILKEVLRESWQHLNRSQPVSTGLNLDIPCPSFPKHPMGFIHAYSMLIPVHLSCSLFSLFEKAVADSDHGFAMKITKGHAVRYHVRMWPSRATPMCDQVGRSKSMPAMACIRNLTGHGPKSSEILQLSWSNIFLVKHRDKCNFYWNLQGAGAWNHLKRSLKPHLTPRRQVAPWPWTRP